MSSQDSLGHWLRWRRGGPFRRDGRPLRARGDAFTVRDVKISELDRARLKKWAGQRIPEHAKAESAVGCAVCTTVP